MYTFTLIRRGEVHTGEGKIIPKDAASDLVSSIEVLREAKEEAGGILDEARKEAEEIRSRAKSEGFNEGLEMFNEHIKMFEDRLKVLRHEMQKAMLPLVLKSTRKIVGEQLEINPDSVVSIVQESIKSVSNARTVKLFVNKGDVDLLEKEKERLKGSFEMLESFTIEERGDVERGGCIIETERGILNATLENQFRALERAFEMHKTR